MGKINKFLWEFSLGETATKMTAALYGCYKKSDTPQ